MKVIEIPVAEIDADGRLRPAHPAVVEQLAADIARRGLRQPIEVARKARGKGWRLVSGLHRLEACKMLGREAVEAVEVTGNLPALQRDQLLENLARNELSALERCQFTAVLKGLFLSENPQAGHGGDRISADRGSTKMQSLASWYADIAARSERAKRTIQLQASIGERLDAEAVDMLRGTDFEDNQFELDALCRLDPARQRQVAAKLADPDSPVASVRDALAALAGQPAEKPDSVERAIAKLAARFAGWGRVERRKFVEALGDDELDELNELIGARRGGGR